MSREVRGGGPISGEGTLSLQSAPRGSNLWPDVRAFLVGFHDRCCVLSYRFSLLP